MVKFGTNKKIIIKKMTSHKNIKKEKSRRGDTKRRRQSREPLGPSWGLLGALNGHTLQEKGGSAKAPNHESHGSGQGNKSRQRLDRNCEVEGVKHVSETPTYAKSY